MAGIMNKLGNAAHQALVIAQLKSPDFSNAEAAKKAEEEKLANAGRSTPFSHPPESKKASVVRNFGAALGHTIHQTIGCFLPRFGAEIVDDYAQKAVEKHTLAIGIPLQAGILLLDLARLGFMLARAADKKTDNDANIAYAGISDKNADGTTKDASAANKTRMVATGLFGAAPVMLDAATLLGTYKAYQAGDQNSLKAYAAITKMQVRNLLYATGRDTMQTAFTMVAADASDMTAHHLMGRRAVYATEEIGAGIAMDYASSKYKDDPVLHAFTRAALNTIPEISDWFWLTHIGSKVAEKTQQNAQPQHWKPSLNKNLKKFYMEGDFKALGKFMKEIGYKFTDQSMARTGVYQVSGVLGSTTDALLALNGDVDKNFYGKSALTNTAVSAFIFLNYRALNSLWQSQGAQRAKLLNAPNEPVADIETGAVDGMSTRTPSIRIEEVHDNETPSYTVQIPETPRSSSANTDEVSDPNGNIGKGLKANRTGSNRKDFSFNMRNSNRTSSGSTLSRTNSSFRRMLNDIPEVNIQRDLSNLSDLSTVNDFINNLDENDSQDDEKIDETSLLRKPRRLNESLQNMDLETDINQESSSSQSHKRSQSLNSKK